MQAPAVADLERLYDRDGEDVAFSFFLARLSNPPDEEQLAELIELDGRKRLLRGLEVDLDRYLAAVPDLAERPDALDAAIEVTLRRLARSARVDREAVESLSRRFPALAGAISEAAALNNAIWSTTGLRDRISGRPTKSLPCLFGPALTDGRARYELRTLLGIGATGHVYLAVDRKMSEPGHEAKVAVKVLPKQAITALERVRLADEATKVRRIDHANVVRVLDRGTSDEMEDYIVSEFVDGCALDEWLKRLDGPMPPREAASLVARMARGVQAAHSAGLVHCDLKPSNILMNLEGDPKVADFGIAMRMHDAETELQRLDRDRPIGNRAFISPEQYRMDDGAFSAPSDIYALGGVLSFLLTRELPNGASEEEIARRHARRADGSLSPSIEIEHPGLDRDVRAMCQRALAPDPSMRYGSAASLAEDLESWLRNEPLYWTRPSLARVVRLWVRRQPMAALMLLVLLVSLVVSGGVIQYFASRAQVEAARSQAMSEAVHDIGAKVAAASEARPPSTRLLDIGWLTSYLYEEVSLGHPVQDETAWRATFTVLERWVASAEAAGEDDALMTTLMKSVLAFWCIGDDQLDRADQLVADVRTTCATTMHLPADDPFWTDLDGFDALIRAKRAVVASSGREELAAAADSLRHHEQRWGARDRGSPVQLVALHVLESLYGPHGLDDETAHAVFTALREEIENENILDPPRPPQDRRP